MNQYSYLITDEETKAQRNVEVLSGLARDKQSLDLNPGNLTPEITLLINNSFTLGRL